MKVLEIEKWDIIDLIFCAMMFVTILGINAYYVRPALQMLFILAAFVKSGRISRLTFHVSISRILFLIWCALSVYWAIYPEISFAYLPSVIQSVCLLPAFLVYIERKPKCNLRKAIKVFIMLTFILCIYVFLKYPLVQLLQGKIDLESRITARGINANQVGVCCSYSILFLLAYIRNPAFNYYKILLVPMVTVALLTGSKKALIALLIGIFLSAVWLPRKKMNKFWFFLIAAVLAVSLFGAVYHIPILYQILGKRIDGLVSYIFDGTGDKSTASRGYMVKLAMSLFSEKPLTGIGLHNFKQINRYGVYSHNNFAEMLSCLGIPGFVFYYGCILGAGIYMFLQAFHKKIRFGAEHILFICILLNEYATVSYTNEVSQLIFGLVLSYQLLDIKDIRELSG